MKSSSVTSCSWCPSSLQLCFHPWDRGENKSQLNLCWWIQHSKEIVSPHFAVWQQEQDPDKGWVPPTPAEIPASHSCTEGTRFRRALTPQQTRSHGKGQRALHTPHMWNSHCVWWLWHFEVQTSVTRRGCGIPAYRGTLKMLPKASKFILKRTGWVRAIRADTQHLHQYKASSEWQTTILSLSLLLLPKV